MKRFFLFFLASVTLVGCSWDDPSTKLIEALKREALEKQEQNVQPGIEFYSEFDAAPVVPGESDETPIYFNSNMGWKAEATSSWFSISPKEGEPGDGSVVIKAEANEEFDTRSGKITFTSGYRTFTITVVQSPKSAIILEKDSFEVGKDGGTITVVVKTTVGFETVVPREYSEWIGVEPYTKALETRYVQLNIARNKGAGRTGYVDLVNKEKGLSARVTVTQEADLPAGALSGEFSVSATKKVYFSKGNLQATYNGSGYTFGFAANQYDYIGDAAGNTTIDSQTYGAVVDLFCWSTDAVSNNWGIHTKEGTNVEGFTTGNFKDWGKVFDDKGTWRTLTKEEWGYLITNHSKKWVAVNGVNGYVIAPDGFTGTLLDKYADDTALAAENLVFLPAASYRQGSGIPYWAPGSGRYWTTSNYNFVSFNEYAIQTYQESTKSYGYSVRLVTEVPAE